MRLIIFSQLYHWFIRGECAWFSTSPEFAQKMYMLCTSFKKATQGQSPLMFDGGTLTSFAGLNVYASHH